MITIIKELIQILKEILKQQRLQKDMFNVEDFCSYTGMSKDYAYHLTSTKKIKYYCPIGKLIYFEAEDVKNFLKQNPVETNKEIGEKGNQYLVNKSNNHHNN